MNYNIIFHNVPTEGGLDINGLKNAYYLNKNKVLSIDEQDVEGTITVMNITRENDEKYKPILRNIRGLKNDEGTLSILVKDNNDKFYILKDATYHISDDLLTIDDYTYTLPHVLYQFLPNIIVEE